MPDKSRFSEVQLNKIKNVLSAKLKEYRKENLLRKKALAELDNPKNLSGIMPDEGHVTDVAAATLRIYTEIAIGNVYLDMIYKLEAAIVAINNGTYGICSHCKEEIPDRRLKNALWAMRCVACEELIGG